MLNIFKKTKPQEKPNRTIKTKVTAQTYYHYFVPRDEVPNILLQAGDYLVRETVMPDKSAAIVLSVKTDKGPLEHFTVEFNVEKLAFYFVHGVEKPSIPELIEHYRLKALPIQGCVLKRPIPPNKWEILDVHMKFDANLLGQGNFASVSKGQHLLNGEWVPVAYKRIRLERLKAKYDKEKTKNDLLREYQIGRMLFGHGRVMSVYGIYVGSEEMAVITEFCDGGALDSYLVKKHENHVTVPVYAKLNFLLHAAEGLSFMHSMKLIHRDVAARNFLLCKREQRNLLPSVKVADFGLTRIGPVYHMVTDHEVPFMVSAIECLAEVNPEWTLKSDCWSFGVLIWTVFDECQKDPYSEVLPLTTPTLREHLTKGNRLEPHDATPPECKTLMQECFNAEPLHRPDMEHMKSTLLPLVKKVWLESKR